MGFEFLGGLNNAFQSYNQGVQANIDRAGAAEDRAFRRTQRTFQQQQQQRELDQQGRDDTLRNDLAKVKPTGGAADIMTVADGGADSVTDPSSLDAQNGSDIGAPNMPATPRLRTQDEELRDIAAAYRKQGDVSKSLGLSAQADQIGMARAARATQDILAGSAGKSAVQLATDAQAVYNSDPLGGTISSIQDMGNGGARVIFKNRDTGQSMTKDFASAAEVAQGLQAHYDPATYSANIKARYEHQLKQEDEAAKVKGQIAVEQAKTVPVAGGATATVGGLPVYHNPREFRPLAADTEKPLPEQAVAAVTRAVKNSDTKFSTPEQATEASTHAVKLITENPAMPPELAARMGIKIALHPELVKPEVNVKTGVIDAMVKDDLSGDAFPIKRAIGTPGALPVGITPEIAKGMSSDLLKQLDKRQPGLGDLYARAAFDPTGRARVAVESAERARMAASLATIPAFAQLDPAQQSTSLNKAFAMESPNIQNRLDMVLKYGDKPAAQSGAAVSRIQPPGGLTPRSDAESDKAWVRNKLMGTFDGPGKLQEIARTNPNPRFRAAAKALYDEAEKQNSLIDTTGIGAPI